MPVIYRINCDSRTIYFIFRSPNAETAQLASISEKNEMHRTSPTCVSNAMKLAVHVSASLHVFSHHQCSHFKALSLFYII